jgi:CRISPR-associated protein Cas2
MARRRYLIAYDISDDVRLRRVLKIMKGYGTRLQYSVFLCDLSRMEFLRWGADIREVIDLGADSIVHLDLGQPVDELVKVIGKPRNLPPRGPMIV